MGAYDGAEVCELVGIFILYQLSRIYNKSNIGLYSDDGLAVFRNTNGPQAEKIKKHFQSIFHKNNLTIIVKCNLKTVDYLDVTLNLSQSSCKPFHKTNSKINYIHRVSNHLPSIIKQLPLSVESRLSKLSSDENVFIQSASIYQEALKQAGYNHKLSYNNSDKYHNNKNNNNYNNNNNPRTGKQPKINTICFNPSFSIKIGRYFFNLVDKHFPREHKFHKIFSRNNIKVG